MSFVDGIGNPQQTISSITSSVTVPKLQSTAFSGEANESAISSSNMQHADETTLSATAALVAQSLNGSDVRSEKVASLQQAIAAGNYSVPSSAVADKIIQSLSEQ
jgi:negative regulator of flagellin synthesis FlgM